MPERLPVDRGALCLLLVDANLPHRRALTKALADRFTVVSARTGAEARRKVREFRPDLIVLDLMLPDVDGLLLMVQLKADTNAAVVVSTTRDDAVDRALSRRLGALDFISKPINITRFRARLTEIVSTKK